MLSLSIHRLSEGLFTIIGTHEHAGDILLDAAPLPLKDSQALLKLLFASLSAGNDLSPDGSLRYGPTDLQTALFTIQGCSRCLGTGWTPFGRCYRCIGSPGNSSIQQSLYIAARDTKKSQALLSRQETL